jgi:Spy/CpxP family protein refolding chaperone
MNALARWKVVLVLIATFVAGAVTGGFLTMSAAKDELNQLKDPNRFFTVVPPRLGEDLQLTPDQEQKVRSMFHEIGDELTRRRLTEVRESEEILDRGQDRLDGLLNPDQRTKLHKMFEERKQRLREWLGTPEFDR